MPFMVIYSTADGSSCHQQADAIDEAAHFVERLRNQEGTEDVRLYRMEEISFAFRPYYKVELGMPERQVATKADRAAVAPVAPVADPVEVDPGVAADTEAVADAAVPAPAPALGDVPSPPAPAEAPLGDPAGANSRRGLFGR